MAEPTPTPRVVPGAPPPVALSKSQRKKRSRASISSAAAVVAPSPTQENGSPETPVTILEAPLLEKAPQADEVAPEVAATQSASEAKEDAAPKSPVVDLIYKRLKVTTKKITRISAYASSDVSKLNEDQRRLLKTLPGLEAVQKELVEVKKAVEVHEAEINRGFAAKLAEAEKAEKTRVAEAVAEAQESSATSTGIILSLLRLHSGLTAGHVDGELYGITSVEGPPLFRLVELLLGEEGADKQTAISGLITGEGVFDETPYARFVEITNVFLAPPRALTPVAEESTEDTTAPVADEELEVASSGFSFINASELEPEAPTEEPKTVESESAASSVNGVEAESAAPAEPAAAINWADDDDELPPVQDFFAGSGAATPVTDAAPAATVAASTPAAPTPNGVPALAPEDDDDGFTQARSGRGRGRPSRGADRGGYRGDRGGSRGGYRGNNPRGGDRGGYRGNADRGGSPGSGFRGRPNGDFGTGGGDRGRGRPPRGAPRGAAPTPA